MIRTVEENKTLVEKYPILIPKSVYTGENVKDYDYSYTCLDHIPAGWAKAFGIPMIEDIQNEVNTWPQEERENFYFMDIKEKFGELRVYTSHMTGKLFEILDAYCAISRNVCIICGKLDVPMVNRGWINPYCRDCATKVDIERLEEYDEAVRDEPKDIVNTLTFITGNKGKDGKQTIEISEYVKKVSDYNATRS